MTPSPSGLVRGVGTARRLRALAALGWPPHILRRRTGLHAEALMWADEQLVTAAVAARVTALYDALADRLGPDPEYAAQAETVGCRWLDRHEVTLSARSRVGRLPALSRPITVKGAA